MDKEKSDFEGTYKENVDSGVKRSRWCWGVSLALSDQILYVGIQLIIAADLDILERPCIYAQTQN